ncbi:asparagine synthase (glutamine-hydrolyzing) [Rhodobacterales bacterium LSUCC0246]|nr:asparagine synthase (glutamine-hydrolyzing) [Rhodobacterales bacterium LSUCC0374]
MCGVAGIVNLDGAPVSPILLERMTDSIAHRGPDGAGHWIESCVGIGHRRLAIIDVTQAGHQPVMSSDHRYLLSYNGEIYNYREIRAELETLGYLFRTRTDSEVVLNALAEWGSDAFLRFNGMFGLAFWDRKNQTLLLARDRYGIKPLYYAHQGNRFLFGSEQKAILADTEFDRSINKSALVEYFTFQNIFTNQTLINNVFILPAGNYAYLNVQEGVSATLKISQYWDYHFCEPTEKADTKEYIEELSRLFNQAVHRQLVGDVEIGAYLSGGMDSGSITAIAAAQLPNFKTFTCGFDLSSASGIELQFDERVKAEAMSALFKTEHYEMVLKAGDMERCLPSLVRHLEEPRVGQSYPNYYAAKLASKFVKVVLSGSGGDELFGGYPWRYYRAVNSQDFEHYIDEYYRFWQRLIPNKIAPQFFSPIWNDVKDVWTRDIFRDVFKTHENQLERPEDYINHSLYFEAKTFLHGLFVVEDKLSMAHGLEARVPFMDNDLVDFAMRCPVSLKLNNLSDVIRMNENEPGLKKQKYFMKTNDGKTILRNVMAQYIPESITNSIKQGFSSPDASWFKGQSMNFVKSKVYNENAKIFSFLNESCVKDLLDEHLTGRSNKRLLIWSLLCAEEFMVQLG